ncbi:hypothetical protein IV203_024237 [Nitzschia inconspicua]|uniref:DUF6824 domain-containing protein n=1 Tax=Nitzschia inconspicua TaxID=303405 RepID=A0A9K3PD40_9STRA|nr:hypothetical protein IV203_024237 [Nitzschia inconspicua]
MQGLLFGRADPPKSPPLPTLSSTPDTFRDPRAVDDFLSRELSQLSFKDRSAINEEIHGVKCLAPEETPELVRNSLCQLMDELRTTRSPKDAYDQACFLFPHSYIHTDEFRLRFLRYELMNPKTAAQRIVTFLECAVELFGTQILERPIQLSDLGRDGMEMMRLGHYQCLPFRDRSGRRILAFVGNFGLQFPVEVRLKIIYYLHWVLTDDDESQRKGLVGVFWWPTTSGITRNQNTVDDSESDDPNTPVHPDGFAYMPGPRDHIVGARLFSGSPGRVAAIHICLPDKQIFHFFRSSLALGLNATRRRIKVHTGEGLALQYALHSYGIPVDLLPITETGNVKTKNHQRFIKVRSILEKQNTNGGAAATQDDDPIECPGLHDVVFRVGDSYLCHPGNAKFRGWIESTFEDYNAASKDRKVAITWLLVDEVLKTGRFLVWDKHWWVFLRDREKMRTKVIGAFKDQKRRLKATANLQENESSTYKFTEEDGRKRKRDEESCLSKCYR